MAQQFANQAQTVISIAYTAGDTSLIVVNGAVFPSSGNFTLAMGYPVQFYLVCTARSGNTLTVTTLGQEGTSTANLPVGAVVTQVITAGVMAAFKGDIVPTGGTVGQIIKKNSSTDFDISWATIPPTQFGTYYTIPTLSMFTIIGSVTGTVADSSSGIVVTGAVNTGCSYIRATGLSTPWNIEWGFSYVMGPENYGSVDAYLRNGAAGAFINFGFQAQGASQVLVSQLFNSSGTYQSDTLSKGMNIPEFGQVFFKIRDDGANRNYYISYDGVLWAFYWSESRGTTYAVDRGGFSVNGSPSYSPACRFFHYKEYLG